MRRVITRMTPERSEEEHGGPNLCLRTNKEGGLRLAFFVFRARMARPAPFDAARPED